MTNLLSTFSFALVYLKEGKKVARQGWNGKGMFLFLICGKEWEFTTDVSGVYGLNTAPFICMKTADGSLVPWLASQTDLLATDWEVVQ